MSVHSPVVPISLNILVRSMATYGYHVGIFNPVFCNKLDCDSNKGQLIMHCQHS